jgi:hypothetical protein
MISCAYFRVSYYPENGDSSFLQNIGNHLPDCIVSFITQMFTIQTMALQCNAQRIKLLSLFNFYTYIKIALK